MHLENWKMFDEKLVNDIFPRCQDVQANGEIHVLKVVEKNKLVKPYVFCFPSSTSISLNPKEKNQAVNDEITKYIKIIQIFKCFLFSCLVFFSKKNIFFTSLSIKVVSAMCFSLNT